MYLTRPPILLARHSRLPRPDPSGSPGTEPTLGPRRLPADRAFAQSSLRGSFDRSSLRSTALTVRGQQPGLLHHGRRNIPPPAIIDALRSYASTRLRGAHSVPQGPTLQRTPTSEGTIVSETFHPPSGRPRRFSLGTYEPALPEEPYPEHTSSLAKAVLWIIQERQPGHLWGSESLEDRFESTYHVCQTLLMLGLRPRSALLRGPIQWLEDTEPSAVPFHFWRAGTLLNLEEHRETVRSDLAYIWRHRKRFVGHRDYPATVFLLKCCLFAHSPTVLPAPVTDLVELVISKWDHDECWFERTSITSMAYALLIDLEFRQKGEILTRSRDFLLEQFSVRGGRRSFDMNLVDDCYTIYNLCEHPTLLDTDFELQEAVGSCVHDIFTRQSEDGYWTSTSPFHGSAQIGEHVQPTAVAVRAMASHLYRNERNIIDAIRAELLEQVLNSA